MELRWEEVVENNAWTTSKGWSACPVSNNDPPRFTTRNYRKFRHPKDIPLPPSDTYHAWVWCGDWSYTKWQYCKKWDRNESRWNYKQGKSARCRRRIWKRPRVRNNDETAQQSVKEIVYENQRYLVKRWASPYLPKDRPHWSDINGIFKTQGVVNNKLPLNWKWLDAEWHIDIIENETDSEGWQYAPDFDAVNWSPKRTILHHVRRRIWIRTRIRNNQEQVRRTRDIRPRGQSQVAPFRQNSLKSDNSEENDNNMFDGQLVVSYTNQFKLGWSTHGVIESSGYQCSIWKPKLGHNEYCLGYLVSAEKSYPSQSFLLIIKKSGSDDDAFRRPTGMTLIWSTRFFNPSAPMHGHFYKPVAPKGYVALGDVAIAKKKGAAVTVEDFPKLVCIRKEFVDKYAELLSDNNSYSKKTKSLIQPHTMIWNTKKLSNTNVHMQLWTQPPFSNEVESPFFVCPKLEKPLNVYPRLCINNVLQDDPDNITIHADWMTKKGKGVGKSQKRFFILASEKRLYYYETEECRNLKGVVDLTKMIDKARVSQKNTEKFEIPTKERKWEFTCESSQKSIAWINKINQVSKDPKSIVNKIIAVQIQGQPRDFDDDYDKDNDDQKLNHSKDKVKQLFDAPLNEQVQRLLLQNINIIKKILKNDISNINKSVIDTMLQNQSQQPMMKKKRSSNPLRRTNSQSSTTSTSDDIMNHHNENKQSIYKHFDDAWKVVRLLLKYYDNDKIDIPIQIKKYVDEIPNLQKKSIEYIMDKISNYVSKHGASPDPFEIIKMCDACALVESFPDGRSTVIADITSNLLKDIKQKYIAGSEFAGCKYIQQRFNDYQKQIDQYENVYSFFIPAKWIVPVTFSLQFCKLTGEQIDQHLKKNPEKSQFVLQAKETCIEEEQKLRENAEKFLSRPNTELDKEEQQHNLPEYEGMISSILDQHLNSYISVERSKAEECVLSAKNETFSVLSEDGSLTEMYESGATKSSSHKHKSCELLLVAIRQGFKKCIQITRGQQLVDLLKAHQQYLGQYVDILSELTREALETNGVIMISPKIRKEQAIKVNKLTERYLWFEGYYEKKEENETPKKKDRNKEDTVIQQILTFLVLVFNSSMYCKESMLNLGKAAHKAIEPTELKKKVDFRPLHQQFESLQFKISERLSQCIMCRIVQDIDTTYKSMNFENMNEKDYIYLEKCRYLVESAWSSLAIQLLYIMPIAQYKLMIKRCIYLLSEYLFESTLHLNNINDKISHLLHDNYSHIKSAILLHLSNESQHLGSEIESASKILFKPTDSLYSLLNTDNDPIPAFQEEETKNKKNGGFDILDSFAKFAHLSSNEDQEPIFYKRYTKFEMKVVEFYHSSNVVLCFQTLLLQLMESQIKINRSSKTAVKPNFFEAFNFGNYVKPEKDDKLTLKEKLIYKVMQCKGIDKETQKKIQQLYRQKTVHDMNQEQDDSISDAMTKKQEWEQQQKEKKLNAQKEASSMGFFNKTPTTDNTTEMPDLYSNGSTNSNTKNSGNLSISDSLNNNSKNDDAFSDDDIIVMKQIVDIKDVDNKIVIASEPEPEYAPKPTLPKMAAPKLPPIAKPDVNINDNNHGDDQNDDNKEQENENKETENKENEQANINSTNPFDAAPMLPAPTKPSTKPPSTNPFATNPFDQEKEEESKTKISPPNYRPPPPKVPNSRPPPLPSMPAPTISTVLQSQSNSDSNINNKQSKPPIPMAKPPPKPKPRAAPPAIPGATAQNNDSQVIGMFNKFFGSDDK